MSATHHSATDSANENLSIRDTEFFTNDFQQNTGFEYEFTKVTNDKTNRAASAPTHYGKWYGKKHSSRARLETSSFGFYRTRSLLSENHRSAVFPGHKQDGVLLVGWRKQHHRTIELFDQKHGSRGKEENGALGDVQLRLLLPTNSASENFFVCPSPTHQQSAMCQMHMRRSHEKVLAHQSLTGRSHVTQPVHSLNYSQTPSTAFTGRLGGRKLDE
ncbi:unnamed protein product [Soboliphyme baturini]|uniref:Uncharacterized protein n=1 Tax=Soboliphyme baturini TaxID=241478 RepID=A0A183IUB6_9BILA|nr:unnamed protein product [Soboliphyme baturini]